MDRSLQSKSCRFPEDLVVALWRELELRWAVRRDGFAVGALLKAVREVGLWVIRFAFEMRLFAHGFLSARADVR